MWAEFSIVCCGDTLCCVGFTRITGVSMAIWIRVYSIYFPDQQTILDRYYKITPTFYLLKECEIFIA